MERFVTLVEPVLLVIMGIVIAGLLLALYMPLFQLQLGAGAVAMARDHRTPMPERLDRARCTPTSPELGADERARRSSSRRGGWPSATGSSSSTWTRSGSIRSCSGRFRPT